VQTAKHLKVTPPPVPVDGRVSEKDDSRSPLMKKTILSKSVFTSYNQPASTSTAQTIDTVESLTEQYIEYISIAGCTWKDIPKFQYYSELLPPLEYTFSAPATSAPVERIFSHGGLFVRPHCARLSDRLLCQMMFVKCNM